MNNFVECFWTVLVSSIYNSVAFCAWNLVHPNNITVVWNNNAIHPQQYFIDSCAVHISRKIYEVARS